MQPKKETVIKSMRSLLNTSKNGLLEKQLRRDFREMEGYEIPYKSFGFNTLLDFIRDSGEFDWYSTNDGIQLTARLSENSRHIVDLVGSQHDDRRKKSMPFSPRINSNANRWPTMGTGQFQQHRQQNSQYFANTTNQNSCNNNTYSWNASQMASTAPNWMQHQNANWNMNLNILRQFQPINFPLLVICNMQVQNFIAATTFLAQAQAQAQEAQARARAQELARAIVQIRQQLNTANANANVAVGAGSSMPNRTVNTRLEPGYQPNQNDSGSEKVPVEIKSSLPAATRATVADKQHHGKDVQEVSDWDDGPSSVIDLTKSSSEQIYTPSSSTMQESNDRHHQANGKFASGGLKAAAKSTSDVDKWQHDLYDVSQQAQKVTTTNVTHKNTADQEQKIASSPLTHGVNTNEPVKKPSAFDRLGPEVTDAQQLSKDIQPRLLITPSRVQKQTDAVDFVTSKQQQHSQQNPFHIDNTAAIDRKMPSEAVAHDKSNTKSVIGSSKQMLEKHCRDNDYDAPIFECRRTRYKKFIGTVCVEGVKYSTEPIEYETETRAECAVADTALENFKKFPISRDSADEIARKIYDCIGDNGVFLKYLCSIFEQKYKESLPDGWPNIIENRPEMFSIQQQATNLTIVFKKIMKMESESNLPPPPTKPNPMKSQSTNSLASSTTIDRNDAQANQIGAKSNVNELPAMQLPWGQPYWKILITSATSPVDIWGRNLESADWDALDETLSCIEAEFSSDLSRPRACHGHAIIVGDLYLAVHQTQSNGMYKKIDYHAYRVRVEEVNHAKLQALCFYIDDGYTEWLAYDTNLYHFNRNLLNYSAQTIQFSLYNVQDFEENAFACAEIRSQLLCNRPFVATVKTKQAQFEEQLEKIDSAAQISVILYDTSTEQDRNVNKDILQKICAQLQPPQLNPRHSNTVSITHVCENADVFCRPYRSKEMQLIQRILDRILQTIDVENYHVDPEQLTNTNGKLKLYLVYDQESKRYYRAIVLPMQSKQPTVMCRCVDYGFTRSIPCDAIYDLARLSYALSNYPHQAILVQLNGIEPGGEYSAHGIQRMRDLLVIQKPLYVDIVVRSEWPIIEVRKVRDGQEYQLNDEVLRALEMTSDAVPSLPVCGESFRSSENHNVRNGHLGLHPKPKIGESHFATVTAASNPSLFYVRLNTNDLAHDKMFVQLSKDCESCTKTLSKNEIKLNHLYAARLQDGHWHRVKAQAFPTNEKVTVQKYDCGDICHLSIDALRPLSDTHHKLHQLVFSACLHDLQPRQNFWSADDCARFSELTVGKIFKIEIKNIRRITDNNSYVAELILIRTDSSNLSEILVQEHRAI